MNDSLSALPRPFADLQAACPVRFANDREAAAAMQGTLDRVEPACTEFDDPAGTARAYVLGLFGLFPAGENARAEEFLLAVDLLGETEGVIGAADAFALARKATERQISAGELRRAAREHVQRDPQGFPRLLDHAAMNRDLLRQVLDGSLLRTFDVTSLHALIDDWIAARRPGNLMKFIAQRAMEAAMSASAPPSPEPETTPEPEGITDLKTSHRRLVVKDLIGADKVDEEMIQAVVVHGFIRPGVRDSGYRAGVPILRSQVWKACNKKVSRRQDSACFEHAVEWLIRHGVLGWVGNHETVRLETKGQRTAKGQDLFGRIQQMIHDHFHTR